MKFTDSVRTTHFFLVELGPVSPRDLAARMGMSVDTVAGQLRRLAAEGFASVGGHELALEYEASRVSLSPRGPDAREMRSRRRGAARRAHRARKAPVPTSPPVEAARNAGMDAEVVPFDDGTTRIRVAAPWVPGGQAWVDDPDDIGWLQTERAA